MTDKVNRLHHFEAVQQTGSTDASQKVNRLHHYEAVQQTASTDASQKVNRLHHFEAVQQTTVTDASQKVNRLHVFAVYRAQPTFYIDVDGVTLKVSNPIVGDWPVTIKAQDSVGQVLEKTFTITINP